MKLRNSKTVLSAAKTSLVNIEKGYMNYLNQKTLASEGFLVDISRLLSDLKRALDFSAYYIFETYCSHEYPANKIERVRSKIYYPVIREKKDFDDYIEKFFKSLSITRPDLVLSFEKEQFFSGKLWLDHLSKLNNDNKHRDFTPQERIVVQNKFTIKRDVFHNLSSSGNGLGDINIGGKVINLDEDQLPLDSHPNMEVKVWVNFIYKDLDIPVLPALKGMLINANRVIDDLENIL